MCIKMQCRVLNIKPSIKNKKKHKKPYLLIQEKDHSSVNSKGTRLQNADEKDYRLRRKGGNCTKQSILLGSPTQKTREFQKKNKKSSNKRDKKNTVKKTNVCSGRI